MHWLKARFRLVCHPIINKLHACDKFLHANDSCNKLYIICTCMLYSNIVVCNLSSATCNGFYPIMHHNRAPSCRAHLMQAVGKRVEALHMCESQQAAQKAVQSSLRVSFLLELPAQFKQTLTAPVQHPVPGMARQRDLPRAFTCQTAATLTSPIWAAARAWRNGDARKTVDRGEIGLCNLKTGTDHSFSSPSVRVKGRRRGCVGGKRRIVGGGEETAPAFSAAHAVSQGSRDLRGFVVWMTLLVANCCTATAAQTSEPFLFPF